MKNKINRRQMLKGLGTVGIGLPLLEEMIVTNALGAVQAKVPVRAFNVFLGWGFRRRCRRRGLRMCWSR
jgi:hypothetical protein